jgi:hypothetical protein
MEMKSLATSAVLLAVMLTPTAVAASLQQPPASTSSIAAPPNAASSTSSSTLGAENADGVRDYQPPPRVTVVNPSPTVLPWSLHEQIAWGANLVLVILGYVGIMMGLSLLKKIERQTGYGEAAAEAAAASAQAALLNAQTIIHSERPWILVTVEPSRSMENSFTVMASNRGRTPAKIIASEKQTRIAIDEKHLPGSPEYKNGEAGAQLASIILLPGESTPIQHFCRDDVRGLCDSEERYRRIETWEEKIFLYGRVAYKDLISPADCEVHQTNWYIHGRNNSGLVMAGAPEYSTHT